MKFLITIAILVGIYLLGSVIRKEVHKKESDEKRATSNLGSDGLPGMDGTMEPALKTAEAQGPAALKTWLERNYNSLQDPKLGDIQLDYAMMVVRSNPNEARRIYQAVKARTPADSPIFPRVKRLAPTLGQ